MPTSRRLTRSMGALTIGRIMVATGRTSGTVIGTAEVGEIGTTEVTDIGAMEAGEALETTEVTDIGDTKKTGKISSRGTGMNSG